MFSTVGLVVCRITLSIVMVAVVAWHFSGYYQLFIYLL